MLDVVGMVRSFFFNDLLPAASAGAGKSAPARADESQGGEAAERSEGYPSRPAEIVPEDVNAATKTKLRGMRGGRFCSGVSVEGTE